MEVTLDQVNQQSDVVQAREGDRNKDPKYFWRMTVLDSDGNPHAIFVSGLATDRGRNYHDMIGQKFDITFDGGSIEDRDGSSWKKAKLDKPGQGGRQGGGGARSQGGGGGGGQQRSGGSGGGSRPKFEMPRDDYFRRFWVLYFENATEGLKQLGEWKAKLNVEGDVVDRGAFWEQVGKVTNQAVMSIGLECLPHSTEQSAAIAEQARLKAEAEAEEKRQREEAAAQKKLEDEQSKKATALNW